MSNGRRFRPAWSGLINPEDVPPGFVVVGDGRGRERLVFAPEVVELMRAGCPVCSGDHDQVDGHDAPA